MRAFVTGGAGFIGSTLVDRLLAEGHEVTAYDNFSTGRRVFVASALRNRTYRLVEGDLLDEGKLRSSILGERYTHGHVVDFYRQLRKDPKRLRILGNGLQRKSYLYVQDCVAAVLHAVGHTGPGLHIFNLGTDETVTVNESVSAITRSLGLKPELSYTGGE